VRYLPNIIQAASQSVLGIVALIVVTMGMVAYGLFRKSSGQKKLVALLMTLSGLILFGIVVYRQEAKPAQVLFGQINDARTGKPIANAKVSMEGGGPSIVAYSDSDGEFTITPDKTFTNTASIRVQASGFNGVERLISLPTGTRIDFRLDPREGGGEAGLIVAGRVIDSKTKLGIGQARISVAGSAGSDTYITEDNGNFRFTVKPDSESGRLRVQVVKEGYEVFDSTLAPPVEDWMILLRLRR
jgi:hypothetical protein